MIRADGGGDIKGVKIISPAKIHDTNFDYIIIGSVHGAAITKQLQEEINVPKDKIIDFYRGTMFDGRVAALRSCAEEINRKKLEGNIAELGVYKGDFSIIMHEVFPDKLLYLFDTFEGFDGRDINIEQELLKGKTNQEGLSIDKFSDTSVEVVLNKMKSKEMCRVVKGYFPESAKNIDDYFCFVSIDADLYNPIYSGLEFFYNKLVDGGYILVHDVDSFLYPGAKRAVHSFCDKRNIPIIHLSDRGGTVIIAKQ